MEDVLSRVKASWDRADSGGPATRAGRMSPNITRRVHASMAAHWPPGIRDADVTPMFNNRGTERTVSYAWMQGAVGAFFPRMGVFLPRMLEDANGSEIRSCDVCPGGIPGD